MTIRPATAKDLDAIHAFGRAIPELRVSATEEYMPKDELRKAITGPGVFLVAEERGKLAGFVYASTADPERLLSQQWACVVYLAVAPAERKKGLGAELYAACEKALLQKGITHVYSWASMETAGAIIPFMEKQGFRRGHSYVWMDKAISAQPARRTAARRQSATRPARPATRRPS